MTETRRLLEDRLSSGSVISGETLASELGISRTAIFKQVARLKTQGYSISSLPGSGYRLEPRPDGLLPLEIRARSTAKAFGRAAETVEKAESTQLLLRRMAEEGAPEGQVVVALEQLAGRGRGGRQWLSPRGGLWFSLLLRPRIPMRELYMLTLLFGVAVTRCLKRLGVEPLLKWPNDILVRGKKICGILLETSGEPDMVEFVIAGIGINANFPVSSLPEEMRASSTTLHDALGKDIDRASLLSDILVESELVYSSAASLGFGRVVKEWKGNSCTIGSEVEVTSFGKTTRGIALDLNPDGSLAVKTRDGIVNVYSGDLAHTRS